MSVTSTSGHLPALGQHERAEVSTQLQPTIRGDISRMSWLSVLDNASQDVLTKVLRAVEQQHWMPRVQLPAAE